MPDGIGWVTMTLPPLVMKVDRSNNLDLLHVDFSP